MIYTNHRPLNQSEKNGLVKELIEDPGAEYISCGNCIAVRDEYNQEIHLITIAKEEVIKL